MFFKDDGRYIEAEALLEKAVEIRLVFLQCYTFLSNLKSLEVLNALVTSTFD